jgi:outer membrane protein
MKKTRILFLALALMLAGITACKPANSTAETAETNETTTSPAEGEIVFVRLDSLMSNFDMYKELTATFETRSTQVETDLNNRGRSLERDLMSAQEKVEKGLVTSRQAQTLQEELAQKQQNFVSYRDNLVNELAEEEQVMMRRINHCIELFMAEFNAGNRYKMVLSTAGGSPIMIADPALDVTVEAIQGLNAYYTANKETL